MNRPLSNSMNLEARDAVMSGDLVAALSFIAQAQTPAQARMAACALAGESVCRSAHPRTAFLRLALDNGADPNHVHLSGNPLLTQLCNSCAPGDDSVEMAQMLLDAGAAIDPICHDEEEDPPATPLMLAAQANAVALVQLLVDCGADLNALDGNLESPLAHAVSGRAPDALRLLLARGADFQQPNSSSIPPLYALLCDGLFETQEDYARACEVARVLLEAGADLDARSMHGDTPRDLLSTFPDEVRHAIILAAEAKKADDQAGLIEQATAPAALSRPRRAL